MIRILIADDHPIEREGLKRIVDSGGDRPEGAKFGIVTNGLGAA